jgi:hypothetical protein
MDGHRGPCFEGSTGSDESFSRRAQSVPNFDNNTPPTPAAQSQPAQGQTRSSELRDRVGEQLNELRRALSGAHRSQSGQSPRTQAPRASFPRTVRSMPSSGNTTQSSTSEQRLPEALRNMRSHGTRTPPTAVDQELQVQLQEVLQNRDVQDDMKMHWDIEMHAAARTRPASSSHISERDASGSDLSSSGATTEATQNLPSRPADIQSFEDLHLRPSLPFHRTTAPQSPGALFQRFQFPGASDASDRRRQSQNSETQSSNTTLSCPSLSSSRATTPPAQNLPSQSPEIRSFSVFPSLPSIPSSRTTAPSAQHQGIQFPLTPPPDIPAQSTPSHSPASGTHSVVRSRGTQSDETTIRSAPVEHQFRRRFSSPSPPPPYRRYRRASLRSGQTSVRTARERLRRRLSSPSPPPPYTRHRRSSPIYRPFSPRALNRLYPAQLVQRPSSVSRHQTAIQLHDMFRYIQEGPAAAGIQELRSNINRIQRCLNTIMGQIGMLLADRGLNR